MMFLAKLRRLIKVIKLDLLFPALPVVALTANPRMGYGIITLQLMALACLLDGPRMERTNKFSIIQFILK